MRRPRTTGVLAVLGALLVVVLGATGAAAQAPEKEVIQVDEMFVDEGLSEECGVEVTVTITGRVTLFTFPEGSVVLQNLNTVNFEGVLTAGDNQIRVRDVGIDQVREASDGTLILSIVGQVPVDFIGVLKINPETEEVLQEPHHFYDVEQICEQLTA